MTLDQKDRPGQDCGVWPRRPGHGPGTSGSLVLDAHRPGHGLTAERRGASIVLKLQLIQVSLELDDRYLGAILARGR